MMGSGEILEETLFRLSMQKKWKEVAELYNKEPRARVAILTRSRETALHVAISSYTWSPSSSAAAAHDHITEMVKLTDCDNLRMQNSEGNTILHISAAVGWEEICGLLLSIDPLLIYERNTEGETPLFVAVRHGNLGAFLCIDHVFSVCEDRRPNYDVCRRKDGNTILHSAISLQSFELAHEIIRRFPEVMKMVNADGESPLHVLASKPSVFDISSSGTSYDSVLYRCLFDDKLKKNKKKQDLKSFSDSCCTSSSSAPYTGSDEENQHGTTSPAKHRTTRYFRAFYAAICTMPLRLVHNAIFAILGAGISEIREIRRKQEQYSRALVIMDELIESESTYKYYDHSEGGRPSYDVLNLISAPPPLDCEDTHLPDSTLLKGSFEEEKTPLLLAKKQTPLLIAAERGILAMVEKILTAFPISINEVDGNGKNALMVAAENRQTKVLDHLLTLELPSHMFYQVDRYGNNVLHLAADWLLLKSWRILSPSRIMQWEYNWYQHVKDSVPPLCAAQENREGKTPWQVFSSTHEVLVKESAHWHIKTLESYSVVAALVATVAFATSATVPGGLNQTTGYPIMMEHVEFDVFSVSSLSALCLSVTALLFFLAIISSPEYHIKSNLPKKLLIGLTCLFGSIVSMLVSFFAGHSFVLGEKLGGAALPVYAAACSVVTIFAVANLPLFFAVKINLRSLPP